MSGKYMDFVPARPKKTVVRKVVKRKVEDLRVEDVLAEKPRPAGVSSGLKTPKLGVIEDLKPNFVKTDVEKRALSRPVRTGASGAAVSAAAAKNSAAAAKNSAAAAKATKTRISAKKAAGAGEIFEPKTAKISNSLEEKKTAKIPATRTTSPFVKTEVAKRPLSKNVNKKKVIAEEVPKGPITIIEKPDGDSKIGTVLAIIVTIILGAAAGTVAFLLLPK